VLKELSHTKAGRKSTLKHAQENASREVSQGRQKIIFGVLRAGFDLKMCHP
jgi:hypothetical protein